MTNSLLISAVAVGVLVSVVAGTNHTTPTTAAEAAEAAEAINNLFVFFAAVLVFLMHVGFAMLEAGGVQAKNRQAILLKNVMVLTISGLGWWALGYLVTGPSIAAATDTNWFMGTIENLSDTPGFLGSVPKSGAILINWFYGFAFAATAATIVSGCIAERVSLGSFLLFSLCLTGFIYPVVAFWMWNTSGWLYNGASGNVECPYDAAAVALGAALLDCNPEFDTSRGAIDFAGSSVVHMVGGLAGLVTSIVLGPRMFLDDGQGGYVPRFNEDGSVNSPAMASSSLPFCGLGTLILWVGWFGFNGGSTFSITDADGVSGTSSGGVVGLILVNTVLCPSAAALVYFLLSFVGGVPDLTGCLNSILGGLVAITCCCDCVQPYAAFVCGVLVPFVYIGSSRMLKMLRIDDVIDASPVHYFCGVWGMIFAGLFCDKDLPSRSSHVGGWWYGEDGTLLGWQLAAVLSISVWVIVTTAVIVVPLKFLGLLRISEEEEMLGMDGMYAKYASTSVNGSPASPPVTADPTNTPRANQQQDIIRVNMVELAMNPISHSEPAPCGAGDLQTPGRSCFL